MTGTAGTANLSLGVTRITPSSNNGSMVPQLESALGTAVSSEYNCVDDNNNVVCQVYKIEVTNVGNTNVKIEGNIKFNGNTLNFENLKYKLMESATLLGSESSKYASFHEPRVFVDDVNINVNETKTYYIVIWINEIGRAQTDKGTFTVTVNFKSADSGGVTSTYVNYLLGFNDLNDTSYFHNSAYIDNIKNIAFVDYIDMTNAVENWDMSSFQDESIMAWVEGNVTSGYYDLYIGSEDVIKGYDMSYFFYSMNYVDSISFGNLDTSMVEEMNYMFSSTGYDSEVFTLDLGDNFDTSNVKMMNHMFYYTGYNSPVFTIDLGEKFDTSNVTSMRVMFSYMGYSNSNFTLSLGEKFDTSNVTDMNWMFHGTGYNSTVFTLDLGDNFDTSNVTGMRAMFCDTGYNSTIFVIDFGNKFNTSKVPDMSYMFSLAGYSNSNLELDLSSFDFSNVTDYERIFQQFKTSQKIYVKDASDQSWILNKGFSNLSTNNVLIKS